MRQTLTINYTSDNLSTVPTYILYIFIAFLMPPFNLDELYYENFLKTHHEKI